MKKLKHLFAASPFLLAVGTHAIAADDHDLKPLHGGIVVESNHVQYELVLKSEGTALYARDHGKAIDLSRATGKITVISGGKKVEHALTGTSKALTAPAIAVKDETYTAVATVDLNGKKYTMRFSEQTVKSK